MRPATAVAGVMLMLVIAGCSPAPAEDASGEQIFSQLCARCHGADLDGGVGPALGPGSPSESEPNEFLRFTIGNGRGRMPSFESTLDEAQIERLIIYIREVQSGG